THVVKRERLQLTIVERGALESADNRDMACQVKAGAKGSTIATTIKWIIDDGTEVSRGDKIILLDDSGFQDQYKTQLVTRDKAKNDWIQAKEALTIDQSQNESDIESAKNVVKLAEIDLDKFLKGDYQQQLADVEGRLLQAESDREMWLDRAAWSDRM